MMTSVRRLRFWRMAWIIETRNVGSKATEPRRTLVLPGTYTRRQINAVMVAATISHRAMTPEAMLEHVVAEETIDVSWRPSGLQARCSFGELETTACRRRARIVDSAIEIHKRSTSTRPSNRGRRSPVLTPARRITL